MKKYNINCIKTRATYTPNEICTLMGVCRRTVSEWIKIGLKTISLSPILILGNDLKSFLKIKNDRLKRPCLPHQFYCFTCKSAQTPYPNSIQKTIRNRIGKHHRLIELKATCGTCQRSVYRYGAQIDMEGIDYNDYQKKEHGHLHLPLFNHQKGRKGRYA